jgi:mannose-1-phosphate guanylyltransferase/mannose-6-phosphate isomerase
MQPMPIQKIIPVILSGGSGTRLWPVSREDHPKQFHGLFDSRTTLMQETIRRVTNPAMFHPPVILGNHAHRFLIAEQAKICGIENPEILIEPCARNTAPAITAAALYIRERYGDVLMLVLPTDQHIANCGAFLEGIERAVHAAAKGYLVTFGIEPEYPETAYGYVRRAAPIEDARAFGVSGFTEKPDREKAAGYIATGDYFWNSGMLLFSAGVMLAEMDQHSRKISESCQKAVAQRVTEADCVRLDETAFSQAPDISIDYALMEHTQRAALVPLACGWSDTGAWETLWRLMPKDNRGNAVFGECHLMESSNCYVRNEDGPVIATYGVDNLVIVATKDAVLVVGKQHANSLKVLVEQIRRSNPEIISHNSHVYRPWGMYESIDSGARYQVKRIQVKPGEKLSLQMHYHRAEHWVVVSGTARIVCDTTEKILTENQSIYIPYGSVHRIENPGKIPLEIIEIQSGSYLGEDDIVRFEDQYGRISQAS